MARLNVEFFFCGEPDLQRMKAPIELQVLRRKAEHVRNFRRSAGFTHGGVNVIAIVIELATGAIRKLRQDIFLSALRGDAISGFVTRGAKGVSGRVGDVAHHVGNIEASRINGIDHDVGPRGAIHQVRSVVLKLAHDESR